MVIIEQNISQVKYSNQEDKLNAINCYEKLVEKEADIIILCEVTRSDNIINNISKITNRYSFVTNDKTLYFTDINNRQDIQNKILIAYDKNQYFLDSKNENLYSIEDRMDFLHITIHGKDKQKINIIGVRFHSFLNIDKDFDDAKLQYKSFCKLLDYASVYDNVVVAGDFNNGPIMYKGNYNPKFCYKEYNYHKMHNRVMICNNLKLLTDGIDTWKYTIDNPDFENKWTSYTFDKKSNKEYRTMLDHFLVSNNFYEESITAIDDKDIETKEYGIPNHKIVKLTGRFVKTQFHRNVMMTNEFRFNLCLFIEFFQYLERDLKSIYAKLIDGYYPDCFDEVAEKPIGTLIKKLKEVENNEQVKYLSNEDYENLEKVREMRNYWCHTCYNETDSYIEQQPDMSLITKHRDLLERLKKEREVVRLLSIKMADISNKIPEKIGKWKFADFIKIIGPIYYTQVEG